MVDLVRNPPVLTLLDDGRPLFGQGSGDLPSDPTDPPGGGTDTIQSPLTIADYIAALNQGLS